jgi:predicted signal transduction protein with EAL and GGDEF domain
LTARVTDILLSAGLDTFSIDKFKIDQSFVSDLSQRRRENKAIIQAIIPLRRTLSIQGPLQQLDA